MSTHVIFNTVFDILLYLLPSNILLFHYFCHVMSQDIVHENPEQNIQKCQ
jgi:hypothetical protein